MIKISILLTFSKLLALLILISGVVISLLIKNSEVIIFAMSLSAGLAGLKSWNDTRLKINSSNETNQTDSQV